jgi:hypothetical protein
MGCTEGVPLLSATSRRVAQRPVCVHRTGRHDEALPLCGILRLNALKRDAGASKGHSTAERLNEIQKNDDNYSYFYKLIVVRNYIFIKLI